MVRLDWFDSVGMDLITEDLFYLRDRYSHKCLLQERSQEISRENIFTDS